MKLSPFAPSRLLVASALGLLGTLCLLPSQTHAQFGPRAAVLVESPLPLNEGTQWGASLAAGNWTGSPTSRDELVVGEPLYGSGGGLLAIFSNDSDSGPVVVHTSIGGIGDRCGTAGAVAENFDDESRTFFGCPGFEVEGVADVGVVLFRTLTQTNGFTQESPMTLETSETDDRYGTTMAIGDFDGDGRDDLAVGAPGEDTGLGSDSGIVFVYSQPGMTVLAELIPSPFAATTSMGRFGQTLATGDFNADNYDDLAVGEPGAMVNGLASVGAVHVFYGTATGLSPNAPQTFLPAQFGLPTVADLEFGGGLAAGGIDLAMTCDQGRLRGSLNCGDELVIGAPGHLVSQGSIVVAKGTKSGLVTDPNSLFRQNDLPGASVSQTFERFGEVLFIGELDGHIGADLAIGVPDDVANAFYQLGQVHLISGGPLGLDLTTTETLSYASTTGLPFQPNDRFGAAITAGDFDSMGSSDLAIGVPGLPNGATDDVGQVVLLLGCLFCDSFETGSTAAWN